MLHALTTPLFRSVLVMALVVGAGAGVGLAVTDHGHACGYHPRLAQLTLDAPEEPNAIYLSAWGQGNEQSVVTIEYDPSNALPLVFHTRATISDGCKWMGIETLTRLDTTTYLYNYDEEILSCDPGSVPLIKTPRAGLVTVTY